MSIQSVARGKKVKGQLSFDQKMALTKQLMGEELFASDEKRILTLGAMLYAQLRIDGVLPKRSKDWEKLDYQVQLQWGASASDLLGSVVAKDERSEKRPSFLERMMEVVPQALAIVNTVKGAGGAPGPEIVTPTEVAGMSLEDLLKNMGRSVGVEVEIEGEKKSEG